MSIANLYNLTVSTERLSAVSGSYKETWQTNLAELAVAIHPGSGEHTELQEGAFYKQFKMWCAVDTDIQIGDRVIHGSTTYTVKGVQTYDFGANTHKRVTIVEGV